MSKLRFGAYLLAASLLGTSALSDPPARKVKLSLERLQNGQWKTVDPGLVLAQGDRVRFRVESNFPAWAYVIDYGTSGKQAVVFPSTQSGSDNKLVPGRSRQVPAGDIIFRVSGPPGQDIVYWILSPIQLPGYGAIPETAQPPKPAILLPRCDDALLRARGECIDSSAGARDLDPDNTVQKPSDLTFLRENNNFVVAGSGADQGPMVYQFRLAHK